MEFDPTRYLNDLSEQHELMTAVQAEITHLVVLARWNGASWREIGDTLGISKQAAQQYYGTSSDG